MSLLQTVLGIKPFKPPFDAEPPNLNPPDYKLDEETIEMKRLIMAQTRKRQTDEARARYRAVMIGNEMTANEVRDALGRKDIRESFRRLRIEGLVVPVSNKMEGNRVAVTYTWKDKEEC